MFHLISESQSRGWRQPKSDASSSLIGSRYGAKYETRSVPLTEGVIEKGRELAMEELIVRTQAAEKRMNVPKNKGNKGKHKKNRNRKRGRR